MNCKPGDLCFILGWEGPGPFLVVAAARQVRDRVVRVTHLDAQGLWVFAEPIDIEVHGFFGNVRCAVAGASDDVLRPIRPGDGQDETLRIACLPQPIDAVAEVSP